MTNSSWQPTASFTNLWLRAGILAKIRTFFAARNVLEVETPLLSSSTIPDPNVHSIRAQYHQPGANFSQELYLQTSPEFTMKRLLAAGSGSIYQICKAFRDEEAGRLHSPEFTMLEWYRIDFDHYALMDEMDELLNVILATPKAERVTYAELFIKHLNINPHTASATELINCANKNNIDMCGAGPDPTFWMQLLLTHLIEPYLGNVQPTFVYDFPVAQAALSRIRQEQDYAVAERFEVYVNGIELANGFHELADADEQEARFTKDLAKRAELNLSRVPIDDKLLAALRHGLPNCAGVALGIDRLVMLAAKAKSLNEALSFEVL